MEYYQYLTLRLGIPVSDKARLELVRQFKIAEVRKYGQGSTEGERRWLRPFVLSKKRISIAQNRRPVEKICRTITKTKIGDVVLGALTCYRCWYWICCSFWKFTVFQTMGATSRRSSWLVTRCNSRSCCWWWSFLNNKTYKENNRKEKENFNKQKFKVGKE